MRQGEEGAKREKGVLTVKCKREKNLGRIIITKTTSRQSFRGATAMARETNRSSTRKRIIKYISDPNFIR